MWYGIEDKLVVLFFFLSTFITQIVILNMLIAIMASTFGNHEANLAQSKTQLRLELLGDFAWLVELYTRIFCCFCSKRQNKNRTYITDGYLFLIQPSNDSEEESNQGAKNTNNAFSGTGGNLDDKFQELNSLITKKVMRNIQELQQFTRERLDAIDKTNQDRVDALRKEITSRITKNRDDVNNKT